MWANAPPKFSQVLPSPTKGHIGCEQRTNLDASGCPALPSRPQQDCVRHTLRPHMYIMTAHSAVRNLLTNAQTSPPPATHTVLSPPTQAKGHLMVAGDPPTPQSPQAHMTMGLLQYSNTHQQQPIKTAPTSSTRTNNTGDQSEAGSSVAVGVPQAKTGRQVQPPSTTCSSNQLRRLPARQAGQHKT